MGFAASLPIAIETRGSRWMLANFCVLRATKQYRKKPSLT